MPTITGKPAVGNGKVPDIAAMSVPDTLAALPTSTPTPASRTQRSKCA